MSGNDISELASSKFNVFVPRDVMDRNPRFGSLMQQLYCAPNICLDLNKKLQEAPAEFSVKKEYLKWQIFYNAVEDVLSPARQGGPLVTNSTAVYSKVGCRLINAEVCTCLKPDEGDSPLGLTPSVVNELTSSVSCQEVKAIFPAIEEKLLVKCQKILSFLGKEQLVGLSRALLQADVEQLPKRIRQKKSVLQETQELLEKQQLQRANLTWQMYNELVEVANLMHQLLDRHLSVLSKCDIVVTSLKYRCEASLLKARILELQILHETYKEDTLAALQKIKSHLQQDKATTDRKLSEATRLLSGYQSLDSGFNLLVERYTKLRTDIDDVKWALNELAAN